MGTVYNYETFCSRTLRMFVAALSGLVRFAHLRARKFHSLQPSPIAVATLLAIALAAAPAWGHEFAAARTVVVQVERCEVAVLVGYRPATGEATELLLRKVASQPKSQGLATLRDTLTKVALAPLAFAVDGKALVPTEVRAKVGTEPGGARPMVVVLLTFALPAGKTLGVSSREARSTRISWVDRHSERVAISEAPAQGKWFAGVASFLLKLAPASGANACATSATPSR